MIQGKEGNNGITWLNPPPTPRFLVNNILLMKGIKNCKEFTTFLQFLEKSNKFLKMKCKSTLILKSCFPLKAFPF